MIRKRRHSLLFSSQLVALAMFAALVTACAPEKPGAQGSAAQSAGQANEVYERVSKTGVLRAAYISYPPACMKDAATGKMSGIFVEALERAAENLGWKVQWTEEVGWGAQIEGLQTNRYDIVGSPVWANPTRGKLTTLSIPLYYSGIGIYVRANDDRFTSDWSKIDGPGVRISTIDGETGDLIARTQFSKAKRVSLPQLTDISQLFLEVANEKADVLFAEPYFGFKFLETNPGKVKNIAAADPIKVLGNCYMMKQDEFILKQALDTALTDLLGSGQIDQLLSKYEPSLNTFYRVAKPFRIVSPR